MLASITPLGERGRHNRWALTVTGYVLGSIAGGALAGGAAGALGSWLPAGAERARWLAFALACLAGLLLDLRVLDRRLPTLRRQVDENWLHHYRGWVYGSGFGFQLGTGVATVVSTSTVYLMLLLSLLSASAAFGGLLGMTYGAVRAAPVLLLARVNRPDHLRAAHRRLRAWRPGADRVTWGILAAVAAGAVAAGWAA